MPVRKKKKSQANRQKMEKAQHLNQYICEVKEFITKAAGPEIAHYIPQYTIEDLYEVRFHPVRVRAAPETTIPSDLIQYVNSMVTRFFKDTHIPFEVGGHKQLSLYDFYSIGYSLMLYAQGLKIDAYTRAIEVKKALAPLAAILDSPIPDDAIAAYGRGMFTIAMFCCNLNDYLYTFKFRPVVTVNGITKACVSSEIYKTRLPKIKVLIEGHHRPALQLGWYYSEPEPHLKYISIRSEDLYLPPGKMLDVYIQSHALNRLAERLDGIDIAILHFNVYMSFLPPKIHRNKKGFLFFEYSVLQNKAGYFLGEVVDEKIVLKTFLFLTNTGTPEADKLQTMTGLVKEDVSYLAIDKLTTFLHSDVGSNERLKQLFIDAGCESLFRIDKVCYYSPEGMPEASRAELIIKYLQENLPPLNRPSF